METPFRQEIELFKELASLHNSNEQASMLEIMAMRDNAVFLPMRQLF
ncbi:hypothetical protein [Delftia acidovorans]|uniref:Uncharacterized protein n=1 Tax=Delftia acidovorans TaxID=80866 RepID=A0AAJ2R5Y1_DELAC|nr:hypothetical protein [Delftia acidovorans]MDX4956319.1 hypothetical protein [Delftia acidovorans]